MITRPESEFILSFFFDQWYTDIYCLDRYSQYGPFFVHIQLAVDRAKNIIHCAVWLCSWNR